MEKAVERGEAPGAGIWAGSGIAVVLALATTCGALLLHDAPVAAQPGAPDASSLDAAFDANVAELEHFLDLGGRLDDRTEGLMVLDASGDAAVEELEVLARHIVASLGEDATLVSRAVAETGTPGATEAPMTGTARSGHLLIICSEAHGGMSIGLAERVA
ncbi:hypothetical protein [Demequina gelatinilytica]|uniref:hypothetical protein n=1 Tax=Demequina gelatinilytica TaxID=1638980 RepID=UPI000784CADB|nr:hypothetical protein [Demequina gelatinilytica]